MTARFLIDAQLPPALAEYLSASGYEADHVADLGLLRATDRAVWRRAIELSATIITKDGDFIVLKALYPAGPSIVWIRYGNTRRQALIERVSNAMPGVIAALDRGEAIIELID